MNVVVGIDEVGRGCWAGPLLAAAVVLDPSEPLIVGLDDSKKLTRARREIFAPLIREQALAYGIGWVEPDAIDISGITGAVKAAMESALSQVLHALPASVREITVVIDGSYDFLQGYQPPARFEGRLEIRTQVGADGSVPAVSAASIVAKVARDDYMCTEAHQAHPAYGFDKHVGYGTALHIAALAKHGVTPLHRMSYKPIKKILTARGELLQSSP